MKKFILSIALTLSLCLQLIPSMPVLAADETETVGADTQNSEPAEAETKMEEADDQTSAGIAKSSQNRAGTFTITDIKELSSYFPDPIFCDVVFKAVKDGADGAVGADVEEALYNFRGAITYNKSSFTSSDLKIKDVHGIQYLRNAKKVSLKYNLIRDFSWLDKPDPKDKTYYGNLLAVDLDIPEDEQNVEWDFSGNPFEKLPTYFGGRLIILQPGAASYTYPEDVSEKMVYMRSAPGAPVDGTLNIYKTSIYNADRTEVRPAGVASGEVNGRDDDIPTNMEITIQDDKTARFSNLEKSGAYHIYIGLNAELKYGTQDDQRGVNITDGAQSFKYYITPTFRIYDRITAESAKGGKAKLTKTDIETGDVVPGAVYSVYAKRDDTEVESGLTTDSIGEIVTKGLLPGDYYFKETLAPGGYELNPQKIDFTIAENKTAPLPDTKVGGGEETITTSDGTTITATANERLFSGGKELANGTGAPLSPDLTLASDSTEVLGVQVTYTKHDDGDNIIRTFNSLADAQTDINTEKNNNTILGPVSVKAYFAPPASDTMVEVTTTDTPDVPRTDIKVDKVWKDNEDFSGTHPDITLRLYDNGGTEAASGVLKAPETSYTFKSVPAEDKKGNKITYTVKEDGVAGYTSSIDGLVVTNTFENAKTTLSGTKSWVDYNNALGTRPAKVTIALLADGAEIQTLEISADESWKYSFKDLPKYTDAGKEITYTVAENNTGGGYTAAVSGNDVTNTLDETLNELVTIDVEKIWADYNNGLNTRPEVLTVSLYQNNVSYKTQELSEKDGWKYSFTKLPKYDADGNEFAYEVKEDTIPENYTSGITQNGTTTQITNTLDEAANVVNVEGTKTWVDYNDMFKMRPASLTVDLYKDDVKIDSKDIGAAGNWSYSFTDLPKFNTDGTEFTYTVKENAVPDGYTVTSQDINLTNTLDESYNNIVKVEGKKTWADDNDTYKMRPESITVALYQNTVKLTEKKVTASDKWAYSFDSLPKYDADGKEYFYTVKEASTPKGYTASVKGYNITNTLDKSYKKPNTSNTNNSKNSKTPSTGDTANPAIFIALALASVGAVVVVFKKRKRNY